MAKLKLSLACWDYDRTRALADGSVKAQGIDLVYLNLTVEETFFRMLRKREFDCAEMSLSSTCCRAAEGPPFVAIPVFPSRFFPTVHLRLGEERHLAPGTARGKTRWRARVPDDRRGLDPRRAGR